MKKKYTYSELCKMSPKQIVDLSNNLMAEYAEVLQSHHENCAAVLFYQDQIMMMRREGQDEKSA